MKTKNKDNFFKVNLDYIILLGVSVLFTILAASDALERMDSKFYDMSLGTHREAKADDSILIVEIDDDSIDAIGEWPWTRDTLANALIRMKELGAARAVFDIEYLSPSKKGVNDEAIDRVTQAFSQGQEKITSSVNQFSQSISQGYVKQSDVNYVSKQLLDENITPAIGEIYSAVNDNMFMDYDDYFARAVQFFGNSWLTINTSDVGIEISDEQKNYAHSRFLRKDVVDPKNLIKKTNEIDARETGFIRGFTPAYFPIISRAYGAGFTNVYVDPDGTRRRIELLSENEGEYVGQLVFAPFLNLVDAQKIERKGNKLYVYGALMPGKEERQTLSIPLDRKGRMLINWQHGKFGDSFRHDKVLFLYQLDALEADIVSLIDTFGQISIRDSKGYLLSYAKAVSDLIEEYSNLNEYKNYLLGLCQGFDKDGNAIGGGISESDYKDYFAARQTYFDNVGLFINGTYKNEILKRLDYLSSKAGSFEAKELSLTVSEGFSLLEEQYNAYVQNFNESKKIYEGSFCIIGDTATASTDMGVTPFDRGYANVGTHANVLNTLLQQNYIRAAHWEWGMLLAFLSAFLVLFFTRKLSAGKRSVCGIIYVVFTIGFILLMMSVFGIYIPLLYPSLTVILTAVAETIIHFFTAEKQKKELKTAFGTYLAPEVVDIISKDPSKLSLGGEDKHITALFSDVKSFSSFSELVTPTKLVSVLNGYLGKLSDAIMSRRGTIDKYVGDEIVSFFGAPLEVPDHAYQACLAGLAMKKAEEEYNKTHVVKLLSAGKNKGFGAEHGEEASIYLNEASGQKFMWTDREFDQSEYIPRALESRVGINTGNMVVGNMGTEKKLNYTMMGDNVNLASRIEGVNKMYHSWVLCSQDTWNEANAGENKGKLLARKFDRVRVVGKQQAVQLINIIGLKEELPPEYIKSVDVFHQGLEKYLLKDFKAAGKLFIEANKIYPLDEAPLVFAARCRDYLEKGLPEGWNGIINMTSK